MRVKRLFRMVVSVWTFTMPNERKTSTGRGGETAETLTYTGFFKGRLVLKRDRNNALRALIRAWENDALPYEDAEQYYATRAVRVSGGEEYKEAVLKRDNFRDLAKLCYSHAKELRKLLEDTAGGQRSENSLAQ